MKIRIEVPRNPGLVLALIASSCTPLFSQPASESVEKTILLKDSLFWKAYNDCDTEHMDQFFTPDVEFYHDKGGLTLGVDNLVASIKKNLCSNPDFRLRREAVKGTVKVFTLKNANAVYGAIISGEHLFYVLEKGNAERLDGLAKFTDLWVLSEKGWRMSRVLSYDHGPAPYANQRKAVKLAAGVLNRYAGQYQAPQAGLCTVQKSSEGLNLVIGDQNYVLFPESERMFFVKDRDLTFEFTADEKGKASKMIVREKGKIVEEAVRKG